MRIPLVRFAGDDTPIAWWELLFTPFIMLGLALVAVWSIPYFSLHPDRHPHEWDRDRNPAHQHSLKRWRDAYANLTLAGRIRRSWIRYGRRAARRNVE